MNRIRAVVVAAVILCAVCVLSLAQEDAAATADKEAGQMAKVKREGDRVVIEGVEKLRWRQGRENTFMGALAVTAHALGDDVSYDYLMGASGAAFRVQLHQPEWCPSAPDAGCGFDCTVTAAKAGGYELEVMGCDKEDRERVEEVRAAVVESINKGIPVIAIDLVRAADYGVITGYADGGAKFLCRSYFDKTDEYAEAERWPWATVFIRERKQPPPRRGVIEESLALAVKLATTKRFDKYLSGFAAYERWIEELRDGARFEKLSKEALDHDIHANAWCYISLLDCREAAARYLSSIAGELPVESREHVRKAAALYEQIAQKLAAGRVDVPFEWELEGKPWTAERRRAEAQTLEEVLALEREAIAGIEKVLAAAAAGVPRTP